jgi:hypothetical protein
MVKSGDVSEEPSVYTFRVYEYATACCAGKGYTGRKRRSEGTSQNIVHSSLYDKCYRVGIAQSVQQRAKGWTAGVDSRQEQDFSLVHSIETDSGAHPASYPMGTVGYFRGGKAAEA